MAIFLAREARRSRQSIHFFLLSLLIRVEASHARESASRVAHVVAPPGDRSPVTRLRGRPEQPSGSLPSRSAVSHAPHRPRLLRPRNNVRFLLLSLPCSANATYAILRPSLDADPQRGVLLLYQLITLAKSPKYAEREVGPPKPVHSSSSSSAALLSFLFSPRHPSNSSSDP